MSNTKTLLTRAVGLPLLAGIAGLAGCTSTPDPQEEASEKRAEALDLPTWYIERESDDESNVIYGFGASPAEPDYPDNMRKTARGNAAQEVAEQLEQTLSALNSDYFDREDIDEGEARTRQQLRQTTEQLVEAELVGLEYDKHEVTEDGRWVVRASYDLDQAFEPYLEALNIDPDTEAARDLRGSAEDHLQQLRERRQEEEVTSTSESTQTP